MTKRDAASLCALKIWSCVIFSPQSEPKIILEFTSWGFQNCYTNSIWDLLWPSLVKTNTLRWAAWVDTTETRKPMPSSSPSSAPSSGLCLMCSLGDSRWEAGWNSEFLVLVGFIPLVQSCEGEAVTKKKKFVQIHRTWGGRLCSLASDCRWDGHTPSHTAGPVQVLAICFLLNLS